MEIKNTQKGITLVALIITIIVLLILAVVSIRIVTDDGIIQYARNTKTKYEVAEGNEAQMLDEYMTYLDVASVDTISIKKSYVGYYANLDSDPEPEGIIYADLAIGGNGQWVNSNGAYSYSPITGTKNYYVTTESYAGAFGAKPVLTAIGRGADRFYVMALEDVSSNKIYWYYNAYTNKISDYSTLTSPDFGTGKTNTATMIEKWNAKAYGDQNTNDMWGKIQDKVAEGWFVPSTGEWSAFSNNLGITGSNYQSYGLCGVYWASSIISDGVADRADYARGYMKGYIFSNRDAVRLSATF